MHMVNGFGIFEYIISGWEPTYIRKNFPSLQLIYYKQLLVKISSAHTPKGVAKCLLLLVINRAAE